MIYYVAYNFESRCSVMIYHHLNFLSHTIINHLKIFSTMVMSAMALMFNLCCIYLYYLHDISLHLEIGEFKRQIIFWKKATLKLLQVMSLLIQYWKNNMHKEQRVLIFFAFLHKFTLKSFLPLEVNNRK